MDLRERGKRRRIGRALDAAREIIVSDGVEGLQMRELGRRAELSVRTLYNHFGSKHEVLAALTSRALDELAAELEPLARERDGLALSRAIITVSIARFYRDRALLRPLLAASYAAPPSEARAGVYRQARGLQEAALESAVAARLLQRTVEPRHLAHQVLAAYNQAALSWARGDYDHRAFETEALYAWACLLLGFARGPARARLLAELEALEPRMAKLVEIGRSSRRAGNG